MLNEPRRFIRLKEVKHQVGYGRTAIYAKIKTGEFPAPISLGARAVAWLESDIQEWIESRITAQGRNPRAPIPARQKKAKTISDLTQGGAA